MKRTPESHAGLMVSHPAELLTSAWDSAKSGAGMAAGEQEGSGTGFLPSSGLQPKCRNRKCPERRSTTDRQSSV